MSAIVLRVSRAGGVPHSASLAASATGPSLSALRRKGCACGAADYHKTLNESLRAAVKPGDKAPRGDSQFGPGSILYKLLPRGSEAGQDPLTLLQVGIEEGMAFHGTAREAKGKERA